MVIGCRELDLEEAIAVKLDLQPDVHGEYGVDATGRDPDPLDLGGRGKGDLCAVDLQRRAGQVSGKKDQSPSPEGGWRPPSPPMPPSSPARGGPLPK